MEELNRRQAAVRNVRNDYLEQLGSISLSHSLKEVRQNLNESTQSYASILADSIIATGYLEAYGGYCKEPVETQDLVARSLLNEAALRQNYNQSILSSMFTESEGLDTLTVPDISDAYVQDVFRAVQPLVDAKVCNPDLFENSVQSGVFTDEVITTVFGVLPQQLYSELVNIRGIQLNS